MCWVIGRSVSSSTVPDGSVDVLGASVVSGSKLVRSVTLMLCCQFLGMGVVDFLPMEGLFLLIEVEELGVLEAVWYTWHGLVVLIHKQSFGLQKEGE